MAVFPQLLTSGMKEQFWIFSIHFWINFFFRHPLLMCLLCSKIFCTPVYQTHQAWEALKKKCHKIWAVFWAPAAPSVIWRTNIGADHGMEADNLWSTGINHLPISIRSPALNHQFNSPVSSNRHPISAWLISYSVPARGRRCVVDSPRTSYSYKKSFGAGWAVGMSAQSSL